MKKRYIFKSDRLGFRNWINSDIPKLAEINSDPQVMEFFPSIPNYQQTEEFIERMKKQFTEKGFCYFAVDKLIDNEFIGFVGISEQNYESEFTPCVDIGWRLSRKEWNKGFATEGAKKCLEFAFNNIGLTSVKSICPIINERSERVMKKLGMNKKMTFKHPLLKDYKELEKCILYEIEKE